MMLPPVLPIFDQKRVLRELMKGERRAAAKARPDAARHAAGHFLAAIEIPNAAIISLYDPIGDELDTEPLAAALIERGVQIALPVVGAKKQPLAFRLYKPGDALIDGVYGARVPEPNAKTVTPHIIVAPLLAFTRAGARLGYGGGYYDRTLKAARAERAILAVGFGFGAQEVDALPLTPVDQSLDWIVTEREAIRCAP